MPAHRLVLVTLCGGLVLAGCGGGSNQEVFGDVTPSPTQTATPEATPTPTVSAYPTVGALSAALATKLAAAGVVTPEELKDWTAAVRTVDAGDDAAEKSIKECLKLSLTPYAERNRGRTFDKDDVQLSSYVDVASTLVQAQTELTARASPDGARCYREFLDAPGSGTVTLTSEPASVVGADRVVALRLALTGTGPAGAVGASGYQLVVQVANTQIWLDSFELTTTPTLALTKLTELATAAVARVKAIRSDGSTATPIPTPTSTSTPTPSATTATPKPSSS